MSREAALSPSRRTVLRSGAAALALGVAGNSVVGTARASETDAKVAFIYDDSPDEDVTKALPVHREYDAPACSAAIAGAVGEKEDRMTPDQLRMLESEGWEIMSHTVNHRALDEVEVTRDVAPDDEKLYVGSTVHAWDPGEIRITDGDKSAVAKAVENGEDDRGTYIVLDGPVGESFDADDGVYERYTDEILRYELGHSKEILEGYGLTVTSVIYPYMRYEGRGRELAPEYYEAVGNANYGGINPTDEVEPYRLNRAYFREDEMTEERLDEWLDAVADGDKLGLLGGHTPHPELTSDRIALALEGAQERGIEVCTLREALRSYGVIEASQSVTPTASERESITERTTTPPTRTATSTPTARPTTPAGDGSGGLLQLPGFVEQLLRSVRRLFG